MIELVSLYKIGLSLLLGIIIGWEREKSDKPCGLRTIIFIMLGATFAVLTTIKLVGLLNGLGVNYDGSRILAYYIVAIGFVGSGIVTRVRSKVEGVTTAALLLPVSLIGILVGMGDYSLATFGALIIYLVLKLKYVKIKIEHKVKKRKKRK